MSRIAKCDTVDVLAGRRVLDPCRFGSFNLMWALGRCEVLLLLGCHSRVHPCVIISLSLSISRLLFFLDLRWTVRNVLGPLNPGCTITPGRPLVSTRVFFFLRDLVSTYYTNHHKACAVGVRTPRTPPNNHILGAVVWQNDHSHHQSRRTPGPASQPPFCRTRAPSASRSPPAPASLGWAGR